MTLQLTIAAPFKHTRKTGMRKNELVYYYALDRKWMSTEQANLLLRRAEEDGLLEQENGVFSPCFDLAGIAIPIGFKPTSCDFRAERSGTEPDRADSRSGENVQEIDVVAEMNGIIKEGFDRHLLPPAALILIAKKYNVPFEDLREGLSEQPG